jgi:4a-hydroxytetrahydrobiopterin dehydratase
MNKDLAPLSEEEVISRLKGFSGWEYKDNKISKTFEFDSFTQGSCLVCELGPFCDKIDHHPDVIINYKKVHFELTRFDIGGKVTEQDFAIAQKIEELYKAVGSE